MSVHRLADFDEAWAAQVGSVLSQSDVARLLGVPAGEVACQRLVRLRDRDGRVVYPAFQFDGLNTLPGLEEVLDSFDGAAVSPLTVASWLTAPRAELSGCSPADVLRRGEVEPVVVAARQTVWALRS